MSDPIDSDPSSGKPFWVTRRRRSDLPQLPHEDAVDEWTDGQPTGRIKKTFPDGDTFIGTIEELDELEAPPSEAMIKAAADYNARLQAQQANRIRHSGLKRNRREEDRLSRYLEKYESGGELTDVELRFLIQLFGIVIRVSEIFGQRYYLLHVNAQTQHRRLLEIADQRGWTQSIINMYGVKVEETFERII